MKGKKRGKKKSLVGWTMNKWIMTTDEHSTVQDIHWIQHDPIFITKRDACDMLRLPDGKYKPQKVRITIQELQ